MYFLGMQDFDITPLMVLLDSSQSPTQVCINITDDNIYEFSEFFTVQLSAVDVLSSIEDGVVLTSPVSLGHEGRLVVGTNSVSTVAIVDNDGVFINVP